MSESQLTIFEAKNDQFQKAFESFITGRTPKDDIKVRDGRGDKKQNYVNTYYMTEQIGLLTGFRWSSECLEEKVLPDWNNPREIGAKMKVTIWDREGKAYSHTSWGQKNVARWSAKKDKKTGKILNPDLAGTVISLFDDLKAAYSDGIKKCLSYFGIARDVYGGKEMEFFTEDSDLSDDEAAEEFDRYIVKIGWSYDQVFEFLKISSFKEITDFKAAYIAIRAKVENKKESDVIK